MHPPTSPKRLKKKTFLSVPSPQDHGSWLHISPHGSPSLLLQALQGFLLRSNFLHLFLQTSARRRNRRKPGSPPWSQLEPGLVPNASPVPHSPGSIASPVGRIEFCFEFDPGKSSICAINEEKAQNVACSHSSAGRSSPFLAGIE